ncbi:MAG: argininosuccinate lyase [Candidatus Firestonebacteria bacterium RIFOXYA2_FULL_40_8]|nr:MAG: argininosuccinate lyase [Candidatus Firestonebacteria bacterium RIFOXYA2_FULL_40_8]
MKLWGGRFNTDPDKLAAKFTASISFDNRLAKYDCIGSIAHVKMLGKQKIIPAKDAVKIIAALKKILAKIETEKFKVDFSCEDIHTNIEKEVIKLAGEAGKKMHTARSRNDQIALDEKLYLKTEIIEVISKLQKVIISLDKWSALHKGLIIPGFTHMQHAQPVKFEEYIGAYTEMLGRDIWRLTDAYKRANIMPLGACALAGTSFPIDRKFVAKQLGFSIPTKNTIDSVSDRDHVIEFISDCAIIAMHLSRVSEEMVLWSTKEFAYVEISDAFTTGSSIMPQKKNPDIFEILRGRTGRAFGGLVGMLTVMKGLPLAYNSDMQEDKLHLFNVVDSVKESLSILELLFNNIKLKTGNIKKAMLNDYSDAVEVANYLVKKGMNFKDAHTATGKLVLYSEQKNKDFCDLSLSEFKIFSKLFGKDIYEALKVK